MRSGYSADTCEALAAHTGNSTGYGYLLLRSSTAPLSLARLAPSPVELAQSLHKHDAAGWTIRGPPDRATSHRERRKRGMGAMSRALAIAKMIGSLLAIEVFVPGGTLIVLTLLVTGRPGSPLQQRIARRFPAVFRLLSGLAGNAWPATSAASQS